MIYRSNLTCPDLSAHFKLKDPPIQHCGHDMPSDPDFEPNCGFLTHQEAAILYNIVKAFPNRWVDIGARFGWSTAHIAAAGPSELIPVDPTLAFEAHSHRFEQNVAHCWPAITRVEHVTSRQFFESGAKIDAAHIDGNHDDPEPLRDCIMAYDVGAQVIVFHDFQGKPVRHGVQALMALGFKCRVYWTPNIMAVCWKPGCGFLPPDHQRDPDIFWAPRQLEIQKDFNLEACE